MPHSPLAGRAATRAVLESHGIAAKKSLGQHFLIDDNIVGKIVALARLSGDEPVLEVGPGIGTLTVALCRSAGHVLAIERDADLLPVLADTTAACGNVTVLRADAVTILLEHLQTPLGPPRALVANLPYGVAATVVLRFMQGLPSLESATVMVQAEVADRMAAEPGSKDYGAYTVKLRMLARPVARFAVSRNSFHMPPRVDSAVIRLERSVREGPADVIDAARRLADAAFEQRRKTLRNSVLASTGWAGSAFDRALDEVGIDGRRRAETLSVDEYVSLAARCAAEGLR